MVVMTIGLELREVETFLRVAEELHFGQAAARLQVSTSNVSQTIRSLERRIGGRLFERTSRTVELTATGHRLYDAWRPAHDRLSEGLREARSAERAAPPLIRIGYTETIPPGTLEGLTDRYRQQRPFHRLQWLPSKLNDHFTWYRESSTPSMDAMVRWFPPGIRTPQVTAQLRVGPPVRRSWPGLLVSRDHPFGHREVIDVEELADVLVLDPAVITDSGEQWAPPTTPDGAVIPRLRPATGDLETIIASVQDSRIAHLTAVVLADVMPWQWMRSTPLTMVPIAGMPPLTCRVTWPTNGTTTEIADFADISGQAAKAAGWLELPPAPAIGGRLTAAR